ncbi:DUF3800 domain-containing protein [Microbispora rosea]|uniref:DUF3800 domain-containing protein n=1 Tax=Microbispora rosea TaxID=58117 RepID=UPI00344A8B80
MHICYLDESGGCEDPDSNSAATPAMVILGLIVDTASIPALTREFLTLKRRHFPGRFHGERALDHILIQFLTSRDETGAVIADGRSHQTNRAVAHSIFTQKWCSAGDRYPSLCDVPLFAASDNHAGLQIADMVASTLVFPMAASAYCPRRPGNAHSSTRYDSVRHGFGSRLKALQYRYKDDSGRWRGGLVVSDRPGKRPGSLLFGP